MQPDQKGQRIAMGHQRIQDNVPVVLEELLVCASAGDQRDYKRNMRTYDSMAIEFTSVVKQLVVIVSVAKRNSNLPVLNTSRHPCISLLSLDTSATEMRLPCW